MFVFFNCVHAEALTLQEKSYFLLQMTTENENPSKIQQHLMKTAL